VTTPELLTLMDRDPRAAYWAQKWKPQRLTPNEALREAIAVGLMSDEDDPGQRAGDEIFTLASERGLETKVHDLHGMALHNASLADLIVTVIRGQEPPWSHPVDKGTWQSSSFIEPSGVRLRRVVIVDRWMEERKQSESHGYFSLGEVATYEMPMTLTVIVSGNTREGKHRSPWTQGWLHPRSKNLRVRKRNGEGFGGEWKQIFREEADQISRDKWIEQMDKDQCLHDLMFDVEVPLPCKEFTLKIRKLMERKLKRLAEMTEAPDPNISACHWPTPCPFREACWTLTEPSEKNGFIRV
jgi:hypothetical protein